MGYTVHELAELSGVSVRTLHHYEEQGLLRPERRPNGYRDYGANDVRRLQQILVWRHAGMSLAQIRPLLDGGEEAVAAALREQLGALRAQRGQLDALIATVEDMAREAEELAANRAGGHADSGEHGGPDQAGGDAMRGLPAGRAAVAGGGGAGDERRGDPAWTKDFSAGQAGDTKKKGDCGMSRHFDDAGRFEAFKQQAIEENERAYGSEVRARYGDEAADASNARFAGLTAEQFGEAEALQARIGELLAGIAAAGEPEEAILGDAGRELCAAHRDWLLHYWTREMYSPAAHRGLAQMYVADERFAAYYEAMAPGGAAILRDAVETWAGQV